MEEHNRPSSSTSRHFQYDIFLSFRGEDTRSGFTDFLYRALQQKHYKVYRDEESIQYGGNIAATLEEVIRESKLSVVVLSKGYASSTWCLNELETIMECSREGWHRVVPIFYHVEPRQVRHQEGRFAESFHKHEMDDNKKNKVEAWKAALRDIAGFKGVYVEKGRRKVYKIIQEIINLIGKDIELMEEHKRPSASTSRHIQYDIFLSFRGETTFTNFLYRELQEKHYKVFRDKDEIHYGEHIAPTLETAIRESILSVVVLSQDYGSSTRSLNELETIMECSREGWHYVVPIFYHVDPHQVSHQEGCFAESFRQHDKNRRNKVEPWKAALREIAGFKGIHIEKRKKYRLRPALIPLLCVHG